MRMFLVVMTDVFLILYLTAMTNVPAASVLTVEDFYKLQSMHATLITDKEKAEAEFQKKLQQAQAAKDEISAALAEEERRAKDMEASLNVSDAEVARMSQDLKAKEKMLNDREALLKTLDEKIAAKEDKWQ